MKGNYENPPFRRAGVGRNVSICPSEGQEKAEFRISPT
jgi:hypothetical protein